MSLCPSASSCAGCPGDYLCRCLKVTEVAVVEAVQSLGLRTVREVKCQTGAGDGCMACHRKILRVIETCCAAGVGCGG